MENRHIIPIAGFDYHQDELKRLMDEENFYYTCSKKELLDDYDVDPDEKIYQYEIASYPLHIEAEPDNPHDPNAVKVFAGDTFVGYVPRGRFGDLIHLSQTPGVQATVDIYGGNYKYFVYDEDEDYLGTMENKYFKLKKASDKIKAIMAFEW